MCLEFVSNLVKINVTGQTRILRYNLNLEVVLLIKSVDWFKSQNGKF
jgi:hypothetical protein